MRTVLVVLLVLLAGSALAADDRPETADEIVDKRLVAITEEMRCLVCQNESLAASQAGLAQDLRREIRGLIQQGRNDREIRDFMVSRYGDFVLYRPPVKTSTYVLWFGPFLLLAAGLGGLLRHLLRRNGSMPKHALSAVETKGSGHLLQQEETGS